MARLVGRRDVGAAAFLAGLAVLYYWPLTIQGRVLPSFDSLVYFYPQAVYLAGRLREGQIPLWNPFIFAGVPFLANTQVGALYPPNWLYAVGPVSIVYAWLVVVHVWWLSLTSYFLGRASLGLGRPGSLFAAVAIAFGGFVGGMSGHLNQLEAFSWTPLVVLVLERAAARLDRRIALLAAIPISFCALAGHSQVLYVTGVLAELAAGSRLAEHWWAKPPWCEASHPVSVALRLGSDLATLAIGPVLAVLIAGAQLLPTVELTRLSIRSAGLTFADAAAFSLPPPVALIALLPSVHQSLASTEWLAYLGASTILLAVVGVCRRPERPAIWLGVLTLLGLFLAFGQYTPLYHLGFLLVPGFQLFRVPARWLTLWTIGVGLLGGWGVDAVLLDQARWKRIRASQNQSEAVPAGRVRCSPSSHVFRLVMAVSLGGVVCGLAFHFRGIIMWPSVPTLLLWGGVLICCIVLIGPLRSLGRAVPTGLLVLLVGELALASLDLPAQQAVWPDAVETSRLTVDHLLARHSPDRVLALGDNTFDPGDLSDVRQMLAGTLPPSAIEQYVTAIKHVEGLTPNLPLRFGLRTLDGYDGGVLPLTRYDALKRLFPAQGPDVADGRLRIRLKSAPSPTLLGWLNVRYLLMDRLRDRWIDGAYYDLAIAQPLESGGSMRLSAGSAFPSTAVGVILGGTDHGPPSGTLLLDATGQTVSLATATPTGRPLQSDVDSKGLWYWKVVLPRAGVVDSVNLTWRGDQPTTLRSLSLIDDRLHADQTVTVSPAFRLDLLGDMKIYENRDTLPRAFLTDGLAVRPDLGQVVDELRQARWDPRSGAIAVASDVPASATFTAGGPPGDTRIVRDDPEDVAIQTSAVDRRVLVLTDSAYPGWRATVDGVDVPIYPVNILFRGVVLSPGSHLVEFRYEPASWRWGLVATAVGILVLVLGLVVGTRGREN